MADKDYVIVNVECSHCKIQQKIHVASRLGYAKSARELVRCISCDRSFQVEVADKIIGGPFPK